jgi:hypothetical protein
MNTCRKFSLCYLLTQYTQERDTAYFCDSEIFRFFVWSTTKKDFNRMTLRVLWNNQIDTLFHVFISCLYVFRASQSSSSGDRIVLVHHLVWLVCVSDCLVCRSGGNCCSSIPTGIPSSHSYRLIIPDGVLIQFDLLMMSAVMLETCRDMKKCVKLVISKNL